MDPETKKFVTSSNVVFDEVSSYYSFHKNKIQGNVFNTNLETLQLLPEDNEQTPTDDLCPTSNILDVNDEHQVERRSARERRQPSYLKDFEALNFRLLLLHRISCDILVQQEAIGCCLVQHRAESVAATMAAQECVWLKRLIEDMLHKVDYPVQIRCDNESTIKLASNPVFHGRTKHIEIRHHYIREKVLEQEIELKSISTNEQVADIFTKALGKSKFEYYRIALGIIDPEDALRGSDRN
ncbi:UNVERIFIED_CONTAM: Retrovirus-related Pol polyprotein from transposon TNT 1-94 [Sesamum latifolium]|uniref:Retrovirus-related Pol polyprotein from transposon TNT 1-94 n=1 Tax=Sesamum latifolium TaxID=2727402 RepID=A0AAW2VVZ3_9LAMI